MTRVSDTIVCVCVSVAGDRVSWRPLGGSKVRPGVKGEKGEWE